jgi:site-specific DNA recombinase
MPPKDTPLAPRRKKYGRVSSDEQNKMATIESQVATVDDWDRAHGGDPQPDDWYIDNGWSGFSMERPALDRLRDEARRPGRDWHEVVIFDASRLSREPGHRLYILEPELRELSITISYVASPKYPDTADGHAMAGVQAIFDKWFADKAKETMRRGLREQVRKGTCWWAPYGYAVHKTVDARTGRTTFAIAIHPEHAEVVRWIYAEVLAGRSTVQITRDLNARRVPTQRGGQWYPSTVRDFVYDPYYIGQAGYGKTQRVLPKTRRDPLITHRRRPKTAQVARAREQWLGAATIPAIIAPEVQERAQAILQGNQRRQAQPGATQYALRGLLHCALYQRASDVPGDYSLIGRAPTRKDGSVRRTYRCGWRNLEPRPGEPLTCPNQLPGPETEDLVWEAVIGALQRTDDLHAALAAIEDAPRRQREQWQSAITRLVDQRERLRRQLRTQQRLLEEGTYTAADYAIARAAILPALEATERDLEHAQRSLAQVRAPRIDVLALEELCAQIAQKAQAAGSQVRCAVLADLLTRIDVHADRLEISGVLGDLVVPLPARHQVNTDGAGRRTNRGSAPAP